MEIAFFAILGLLIGIVLVVIAVLIAGALLPFFGQNLLDDPDHPEKFAIFTKTEFGRSSVVMRGGNIQHVIHGKQHGHTLGAYEQFNNPVLRAYDAYAFRFGLRLIGIPGVHTIKSYDLPRYRKSEEGGKIIMTAVTKGDPGYRSNHIRTQMTPLFYELSGVDIEGIPFRVKGAVYTYFDEDRVLDGFFKVESWVVLLYQVLNSTVRGKVRESFSLDDAIGAVSRDIWEEKKGNPTQSEEELQSGVMTAIKAFVFQDDGPFKDMTLKQAIGLNIARHDILDFSPEELTPAQQEKLLAPALERRSAQGRELAGKGERAYQAEVLAALAAHPDLAKANVDAEARVKMAKAGAAEGLLAALINKLNK